MSNSLRPPGLQHTWLPWPSPSPSLLRFLSIEFVMLSNHLILCHPLLLLPSIFPNIRVFSKESALHIRWPKYQSLNISPSNEYSELISFRIDWFDLLAVQGTLKRLLQHDSSKALILQGSAFFMVKLSHPYLTAAAKSLQSCLTVGPYRPQPTRLPCFWDSPGKNTGVGCPYLLQCMKVKSESEVAQSCLTLSNPMDCSLPGSSIHGTFQARVLEWGAIAFSTIPDYWKATILQ